MILKDSTIQWYNPDKEDYTHLGQITEIKNDTSYNEFSCVGYDRPIRVPRETITTLEIIFDAVASYLPNTLEEQTFVFSNSIIKAHITNWTINVGSYHPTLTLTLAITNTLELATEYIENNTLKAPELAFNEDLL